MLTLFHMASDDKKLSAEEVKEILLGASSPEKRIPKYCNGVLFGKLKDGGVIMTFVAKEDVGHGTEKREESIMIERVFIDKDHAKQIAETLTKLTNEI